jgi:hypothetical protein
MRYSRPPRPTMLNLQHCLCYSSQLQRQAELTAEENAAWQLREQHWADKQEAIAAGKQAEHEERQYFAARAAENRAAKAEAAARHEEAVRAAAAAKVHSASRQLRPSRPQGCTLPAWHLLHAQKVFDGTWHLRYAQKVCDGSTAMCCLRLQLAAADERMARFTEQRAAMAEAERQKNSELQV